MANRRLKRMELPKECEDALEKAQIVEAKDVLNKNKQELVNLLGLHQTVCTDLIARVAANICPIPRSVSDCIRAKRTKVCFLATGMVSLDATLRGGLPCGGITEIVGAAGAGKTQFCLQSCVQAIGEWAGHSAIYVDTESRFSPDRLLEIAGVHFPNLTKERHTQLADSCIVYTVQSIEELCRTFAQLEEVVIEKNVQLIVVDSVASLPRHEFNGSSIASRQAELTKEAQTLKYLGETFNIPILVTNQVTTKFRGKEPAPHLGVSRHPSAERDVDGESFLTAALGNTWSHCVNTRIVLEQTPATRRLTVAKSPIAPVMQIDFDITAGGIILTSDAVLVHENFWSMRIHTVSVALPERDREHCNEISNESDFLRKE